jgi:hypothetical protein
MRDYMHKIYLQWVNDFLTIERFAEFHGLYVDEAEALIATARLMFERVHPEA